MATIEALLQWQNLLFCLSLLVSMLLIFAVCAGGGNGDADADIDTEVDMNAEADVEVHGGNILTDVDISHPHVDTADEVPHDIHDFHDVHGDHGDVGVVWKSLSLLGIGKMPLMLILFFWTLFFGGIGLMLNFIVWKLLTVSVFVALGGSIFLTSFLAQMWRKLMPKPKSYVSSPKDWVGLDAIADQTIDSEFGYAYVYDQFGNRHGVIVVLDPSILTGTSFIAKGSQILLLSYNPDLKRFTCRLNEQENKIIN
ncbi:MAG: YqiJ family protein [Candidatus Peribacteria bacterium]|nr:YqiJ family protein [Candidatus Peribacteria bacterium]